MSEMSVLMSEMLGLTSEMSGAMPCESIETEQFLVVVKFKRPLRTRVRKACTMLACISCLCAFFPIIFVTEWLVQDCRQEPIIALQDLRIRDMAVHQTVATPVADSQWQVSSTMNVTFVVRNKSRVPGCYTTYRHMTVFFAYNGSMILLSEFPLGFSLNPGLSHEESVELKVDNFQMREDSGPVDLEAALQGNHVPLEIFFEARYLTWTRASKWARRVCFLVAKTPPVSSQSVGIISNSC